MVAAVSPKWPQGKASLGEHPSPSQGIQAIQGSFLAICFNSCGPNREQHLLAGVLVLMFDSEKGNILFLNAFENHLFVKCFKYLIMRRCRLCYLVLKLKRKMLW